MAEQSISYGIGLSDQQLNAMLNSDVPEIRQQAENYVSTAQQQQTEKPNIQLEQQNQILMLLQVLIQQINFHLNLWLIWQLQMS